MSAKRYLAAVVAVLPLLTVPPGGAQQPLPDAVYEDVNQAVIRDQIVPAAEAMAAAADGLEADLQAYCAAPDASRLERARAAFHAAYDRWMTLGWVSFGPQALHMRAVRMHFWPDSRNTLGRQLAGVLNAPREDLLELQTLSQASVALQGLPALERLLFDATPISDDDYACELAAAIAGNVQAIAAELAAGWGDSGRLASELPGGAALTANLFQSVHEQLELIVTRKIVPVLGENPADARARSAENWRSERAVRNIVVNLTAILGVLENGQAMGFADVLRDHADRPDVAAAIVEALEQALAIARSLEDRPIADLVEEEAARADVWRMAAAIDLARKLWSTEVGEALGLTIGFNRLDGD